MRGLATAATVRFEVSDQTLILAFSLREKGPEFLEEAHGCARVSFGAVTSVRVLRKGDGALH